MTASDVSRFALLATFVAGRSVDIAEAPAGTGPHTDGRVVFVSPGHPAAEQRREMLLQSALLGAGSLHPRLVKGLRARPSTARRYLALEGTRALTELADRVPLAAELCRGIDPRSTASADESLEIAKGRSRVTDPPSWFGVIKPARLLSASPRTGGRATDIQLQLAAEVDESPATDDDQDDGPHRESKILKLFDNPLVASRTVSDYLRKLLGSSRGGDDADAGAEMQVRAIRRAAVGADARPLPTRIQFTDDGNPGAAVGVGGALHPEWDVHRKRYRPQWCRVIDFPLSATGGNTVEAGIARDEVLRRRLARVGLGPRVFRGRPDGDEVDIEALIDLFVDLRSGHSPPENVYCERRKLARNLGVLILVDASGSGTDTDPHGLAVHDHQRRAAATLAVTLEELGDRVAVYGFRSQGRHSVHLPMIKGFGQRFGAIGKARLDQLRPQGYTRLGAGIRGAGEILKAQAGTPNKLLLVLSDGYPYDHGYEGRYAEADADKALEELRADGVACLCLSIGSGAATIELERVFGSAGFAGAPTLADLSGRMDELFLTSLRELAAPNPTARTRH